jgi:hypothetical protein
MSGSGTNLNYYRFDLGDFPRAIQNTSTIGRHAVRCALAAHRHLGGAGAGKAGRLTPSPPPQQLRQPRDVHYDAARLVGGKHFGLPGVAVIAGTSRQSKSACPLASRTT